MDANVLYLRTKMINSHQKPFHMRFSWIFRNTKGFQCYDIKNDKLYVSRNVTFLENDSGFEKCEPREENMDYSFLFDLLSRNDDISDDELSYNDI